MIKVRDLTRLLARIDLPFEAKSMRQAILRMYLPIIKIQKTEYSDSKEGAEPTKESDNYYLFNDVLAAITHLSTEKNIRSKQM